MYHRVLPPDHADRAFEQPGMYVSPATFDLHVQLLKRHFTLVHLDEWVRRALSGEALPDQACAVTFDDGWRDNFEHAFPVLRRHAAPATIFLVSGMTGTNSDFWPNRLARMLVRLRPAQLKGPLGGVLAPLLARVTAGEGWSAENLDAAVVTAKQLDERQINQSLDEMQAEVGAGADCRAVLDHSEIQLMAASGLVRYGSHTRTHCRFRGEFAQQVLEDEILGSRTEIATFAGDAFAPVFCYPNGDITPAALAEVRRHYAAAVTTCVGWHGLADDPFLIRRVGMHEDVSNRASGFLARLARAA
jgi:peptidoglycan/xylan/chitin deacetylase (PgdA/CDA1 family)